ncbi:MAG: hypothetical protein GTO63_20325 [Anaerolineae bacterium]|nr:hypothetical protein [Anaerolineae bacterium]NIN97121.1 hypothetical protein [Anaerolineae bacterium]NIQ80094.1 hypothetical protein [Anaerolineae bacterium]
MSNNAMRRMMARQLGRRQSLGLRRKTWWLAGGLVTLAVMLLVSACGTSLAETDAGVTRGTASPTRAIQQQPIELPSWVVNGSEKVQAAYIAATLHAAELAYIPCYCSCGQFGHDSVIDCFISGADATGAPIYDNHAYY